ncbi:MAG: hypothetical protein CM1200mP22_09820 [Dehalococcoidia bacterium]|nr:MAG: hypothetical protein CM1200mP22_09820 [Dehalococcoidia bacterium]
MFINTVGVIETLRAANHHGFDVGWSNEQVRHSQDHPKTAGLAYCDAGMFFRVFQLYNRRLNGKGYFIFAILTPF